MIFELHSARVCDEMSLQRKRPPISLCIVKLYRTGDGLIIEQHGKLYSTPYSSLDELIGQDDLPKFLASFVGQPAGGDLLDKPERLLPPIGTQEVWAAGVTYLAQPCCPHGRGQVRRRRRFLRPRLHCRASRTLFKATPSRVVGDQAKVAIRKDANWSVPEPELTLMVSPGGKIMGYTIGNDMSSRDIEGENPLYLPQAKVYQSQLRAGAGVLISSNPLPSPPKFMWTFCARDRTAFPIPPTLASMKRDPRSWSSTLYRDNVFPQGCFPAYRDRHRSTGFIHAPSGRRNTDYH